MNSIVSVIGMGFVGLTLSTFLSSRKIPTIGIDTNSEIIAKLQAGIPHFYEKDLEKMLRTSLRSKMLSFSSDIANVRKSKIIFVCVGTPNSHNGEADLSAIRKVSEDIANIISMDNKCYRLIAVKSTVVPGTTAGVILPQIERVSMKRCGTDFGLVMNPEFLREGSAIHDTMKPHLIVIGGQHLRDIKILRSFYSRLYAKSMPDVIETTPSTAELIKYANNAFLATKISFINSIANMCQRIRGADIETIAVAIGRDPRIGPLFLKAGPGYGGSCLPKDVSALISFCKNNLQINPLLISATNEVNSNQPYEAIRIAEQYLEKLSGKVISILGLAFKKDTDDIREAVSIKIIGQLLKMGAVIRVHDPMALTRVEAIFGNKISYFKSADECVKESDCCFILTEWKDYSKLKPSFFIKHMKSPIIIDARRVLNPSIFEKEAELTYLAVGRNNEN